MLGEVSRDPKRRWSWASWYSILSGWFSQLCELGEGAVMFVVKEHSVASLYLHSFYVSPREYWMIYGGPGFLAVLWFGSPPTHFPPSPVSILSFFLSLSVSRLSSFLTEGGWLGTDSYDRENAWASTNHSIPSAPTPLAVFFLPSYHTVLWWRKFFAWAECRTNQSAFH